MTSLSESDKKRQQRLKAALKARGVRFMVADIVKNTNYSSGIASEYVSGKKPISDKFLSEISDVYKISEEWLLTGKGQMIDGKEQDEQPDPSPDQDDIPAEEFEKHEILGDYSDDIGGYLARHYTPVGLAALYILSRAYAVPMDQKDIAKLKAAHKERVKLIYDDVKTLYEMDIEETQVLPMRKSA